MADSESTNVLSPLEGEGMRGDGTPRWYVVHTYSGHEKKVKVNIEKMVENRGMQDLIQDIVVPTEERVEIKNGEKKIKTNPVCPAGGTYTVGDSTTDPTCSIGTTLGTDYKHQLPAAEAAAGGGGEG